MADILEFEGDCEDCDGDDDDDEELLLFDPIEVSATAFGCPDPTFRGSHASINREQNIILK